MLARACCVRQSCTWPGVPGTVLSGKTGSASLLLRRARSPRGKPHPGLVTSRSQVGKTTLLNHIAGGLIADFPQDIKVVHVQHEILANDEQSVLDYMQAARASHGAAPGAASVSQVLDEMGFTPELQRSAVLELSGGWRMRLALAGAILSRADLLLLDEPTNHLDVRTPHSLSLSLPPSLPLSLPLSLSFSRSLSFSLSLTRSLPPSPLSQRSDPRKE